MPGSPTGPRGCRRPPAASCGRWRTPRPGTRRCPPDSGRARGATRASRPAAEQRPERSARRWPRSGSVGIRQVGGGRAVVRVDDELDRVADVVEAARPASNRDSGRWSCRRRRSSTAVRPPPPGTDPGRTTGTAPAVCTRSRMLRLNRIRLSPRDVIAQHQLIRAEAQRKEQLPPEASPIGDAARPVVLGEDVVLALRVVELLRRGPDDDVVVRQLAEVEARLLDRRAPAMRHRRQVPHEEHRQSFLGDLVHRVPA